MNKKNIIIILAACLAALCSIPFIQNCKKEVNQEQAPISEIKKTETIQEQTAVKENIETKKTEPLKASAQKDTQLPTKQTQKETIKKANLFNETPNNMLPLSAIGEIAGLPHNIQNTVKKVIDNSNGVYMLKRSEDKILMVVDNPDNIRQGVDFVEISLKTGQQTNTTLGYSDRMKDSDNDSWEFDKETNKPIKHVKYKKDGHVEFIETWNYDDSNPIKYQMKDGNGKVISMRKETLDNGTDMRIEHLIYDKDGNTKVNVSASYEGADIKRFTYYNADKPSDGASVYGEYSLDGLKTKETVYTSDLKVKNTYTSDYKDGNRDGITILDSNNREVETILAE